MKLFLYMLLTLLPLMVTIPVAAADLESRVKHGYADNNGVKIHYASLGEGPLIVMIHGFPDFWYVVFKKFVRQRISSCFSYQFKNMRCGLYALISFEFL